MTQPYTILHHTYYTVVHCVCMLCCSVMSDSLQSLDYSLLDSTVHGMTPLSIELSRQELWSGSTQFSHSVMSDSLQPHGLQHTRLPCPSTTGVGSHSLLQGIFPTEGLNSGLLHCRQILYHLSHQGSSRILEWVAYPFSSGSSPPRNQTGVSCIAGRFFTK